LLRLAPILRQFLCGITPWSRGNSRAATFSRLRPKLRANTRAQTIVMIELQLGVRAAGSAS
jgi:hypothetical protein